MRRPALEVLFARAAQGRVFLLLLLGGMLLGLLTLLAEVLRRACRGAGAALEALCAALAGGLLLAGLFFSGDGLRLYAMLGLLLGAALSRAGGRLLADCGKKIFRVKQE